jgi:hypothetical protein
MTGKVERIAAPIRARVEELTEDVDCDAGTFARLYGPRVSGLGFSVSSEDAAPRAAWMLVSQWLVGYAVGALSRVSSLADAEEWFGLPPLEHLAPAQAGPPLPDEATSEVVFALLPYLLDPLALATRRCVIRDRTRLSDRQARKGAGIYYTPADLAQSMADSVVSTQPVSCLDPACGSGVFLRAALTASGGDASVFGADIDALAGELCTFVLLAHALVYEDEGMTPWAQWHLHRRRIATVDSLLLNSGSSLSEIEQQARAREVCLVESSLRSGGQPPAAPCQRVRHELGSLFPELREGADVLLCNPPYAQLGDHPYVGQLARSYATFSTRTPTAASNIYPAFVEHAWRLTKTSTGRAVVVVPLSLAASSTPQFRALRTAIGARRGHWSLSFYDRAPDALFGDDVKTRNAVLRYDGEGRHAIQTTGLLRWTSRTRFRFLRSVRHTDITDVGIRDLIPKLGGDEEVVLYRALRSRSERLTDAVIRVDKVAVHGTGVGDDGRSVYIAPTAYNWLGVVRDLRPWESEQNLAATTFVRLSMADEHIADATYAALASRLAYWLWRVEGDGFHVPVAFLTRLPISVDLPTAQEDLARLGRRLWETAREHPTVAVNKGRRSIAFPTNRSHELLDQIDTAVARASGVEPAVCGFDLRSWYQGTVVVDENDSRRRTALMPQERRDA